MSRYVAEVAASAASWFVTVIAIYLTFNASSGLSAGMFASAVIGFLLIVSFAEDVYVLDVIGALVCTFFISLTVLDALAAPVTAISSGVISAVVIAATVALSWRVSVTREHDLDIRP